jgi:hypothetical protein
MSLIELLNELKLLSLNLLLNSVYKSDEHANKPMKKIKFINKELIKLKN